MTLKRVLIVVASTTIALLMTFPVVFQNRNAPSTPAKQTQPLLYAPARFLGMVSCATAGCHGGNGTSGERGSEFTTWQADPHARAFKVLKEERSRIMVQRVYGEAAGAPEKNQACLSCHDPSGTAETPRVARFGGGVGVACESCHGAAERWREPHSRADWGIVNVATKVTLGMTNIWDVGVRARLCARCHVGKEGATVNHDLIAAGHPQLQFELNSAMARLPRHWQTDHDADGRRISTGDLWAAGLIASARAEFLILAEQASNPSAPWPEFSKLDCSSCHHSLADRGWRRPQGKGQSASPFRPADRNSTILTVLLAKQRAGAGIPFDAFPEHLLRLKSELASGSTSSSSRNRIVGISRTMAKSLPEKISLPTEPWPLVASLATLDREEALTHDFAIQRFHAISALAGSVPRADRVAEPAFDREFRRLAEALGNDPPFGFQHQGKLAKPFDPDEARAALKEIAVWARSSGIKGR